MMNPCEHNPANFNVCLFVCFTRIAGPRGRRPVHDFPGDRWSYDSAVGGVGGGRDELGLELDQDAGGHARDVAADRAVHDEHFYRRVHVLDHVQRVLDLADVGVEGEGNRI